MRWAKQRQVPLILAGHMTKDGSLAGPRVLEHMVVEIASKICHEEDRERGANIIPAPRHV